MAVSIEAGLAEDSPLRREVVWIGAFLHWQSHCCRCAQILQTKITHY